MWNCWSNSSKHKKIQSFNKWKKLHKEISNWRGRWALRQDATKSWRLQIAGNWAGLLVDIPRDHWGRHQLAAIGGKGKSEHQAPTHLIRAILILHLLQVGDHGIVMTDVVQDPVLSKKDSKGGKSVQFTTFDGAYNENKKALQFIRQFDIAFQMGDYKEKSKLKIC